MISESPAPSSDRAAGPALAVIAGRPLPASGNVALAASAVVQASLGIEFSLAGLNKLADPHYVANFSSFVSSSPGSSGGPLALLVQAVVLPNADAVATLIKVSELILGPVLLIGALGTLYFAEGSLRQRLGTVSAVQGVTLDLKYQLQQDSLKFLADFWRVARRLYAVYAELDRTFEMVCLPAPNWKGRRTILRPR